MSFFVYRALDEHGELVESDGEFLSVDDLFADLQGRRLDLLECKKSSPLANLLRQKKVKRLVLAEFLANLALLLKGGVPLREGVHDLLTTTNDPVLKMIFTKIQHRLDDGHFMSEALVEQQKSFPAILIPLVAIGEETGTMDRAMEDGARHLERVEEIISTTRQALIYPSFVVVAMSGALAFWMLYVLPQLLSLFTEMGVEELPLTTRFLIFSSGFSQDYWYLMFLLPVLLFLTWLIVKRDERLKLRWDMAMLKVPLIGPVIRYSQLAFFFEYTSILSGAGINILRSLELMQDSVSNMVMKKSVQVIRVSVSGGQAISEAISTLPIFEPFVLRMITVGEKTGNMPEQMAILAEYYRKKVNKIVETMSKVIEPVIIIVAGGMFLLIILGLLGPIYDLISTIE